MKYTVEKVLRQGIEASVLLREGPETVLRHIEPIVYGEGGTSNLLTNTQSYRGLNIKGLPPLVSDGC